MMLYQVLKLVRFTVKKEVGKVVETWGRVGVRAQEFQKVRARASESKKGAQKGPKFRILKILRLFENLVPP